jgi:D-2-hydroxyacid dehydrogenase (NADP+)
LMTRVLLLLNMPERLRNDFHGYLKTTFPAVDFDLVDNVTKIDPYLEDAEILMTHGPYLSTRADYVLGHMPNLRWVQGTGTGVDNIIDRPTLPADVLVTNMRGAHGPQMSEAAIGSMLALARKMPRTIRNQDKKVWERWLPQIIQGKTVGILGVGVIAEALAPKCKAFGMRVVGITSAPRPAPGFDEMRPRDELLKVVGDFDFFVLLTPLTDKTRNSVNADVFAAMKPTSFLINLARGGVVDEPALIEALKSKRIAGAALDVFSQEPLPPDHPLWSMHNVIITTHQGGFCDVYVDFALPVIEKNMECFLKGDTGCMINVVAH